MCSIFNYSQTDKTGQADTNMYQKEFQNITKLGQSIPVFNQCWHISNRWAILNSLTRRIRKRPSVEYDLTVSRQVQASTMLSASVDRPGSQDLAPKWMMITPSQNVLKSDLKKSRNCPIWGQIWHPWKKEWVWLQPHTQPARCLHYTAITTHKQTRASSTTWQSLNKRLSMTASS